MRALVDNQGMRSSVFSHLSIVASCALLVCDSPQGDSTSALFKRARAECTSAPPVTDRMLLLTVSESRNSEESAELSGPRHGHCTRPLPLDPALPSFWRDNFRLRLLRRLLGVRGDLDRLLDCGQFLSVGSEGNMHASRAGANGVTCTEAVDDSVHTADPCAQLKVFAGRADELDTLASEETRGMPGLTANVVSARARALLLGAVLLKSGTPSTRANGFGCIMAGQARVHIAHLMALAPGLVQSCSVEQALLCRSLCAHRITVYYE